MAARIAGRRVLHRCRVAFSALLVALLLSLSSALASAGHAASPGSGDLMAQVPPIDEHDLKASDIRLSNNACGVAAATMVLDYYLPQNDPAIHAAISLDAVAKTSDTGPGYVRVQPSGTNTDQLKAGLEQAGPALDGVALTAALKTTDRDHWFDDIKAEVDAKLPVIVFLANGGLINANKFRYGHFIVVSGYTADNSIIYHETYDGAIHDGVAHPMLSNSDFANAWGATLQTAQGWNPPWNFLEVLPPNTPSPLKSNGGGTPAPPAPTATSSPTSTANPAELCRERPEFANAAPAPTIKGPDLGFLPPFPSVPFPPNSLGYFVSSRTDFTYFPIIQTDLYRICSPNISDGGVRDFYAVQMPRAGWIQSATFPYGGDPNRDCGDPYCWNDGGDKYSTRFVSLETVTDLGPVTVYELRLSANGEHAQGQ